VWVHFDAKYRVERLVQQLKVRPDDEEEMDAAAAEEAESQVHSRREAPDPRPRAVTNVPPNWPSKPHPRHHRVDLGLDGAPDTDPERDQALARHHPSVGPGAHTFTACRLPASNRFQG